MDKTCIKCNQIMDESLFAAYKKRNQTRTRNVCKLCFAVVVSIQNKKWAASHIKKSDPSYYINNRKTIIAKTVSRQRQRRQNDPLYRFKCRLRTQLFVLFKQFGQKRKNTNELLGCTIEQLREYLRSKYQPNMTDNNYGEWHIDHIIPLASARTKDEMEKLCHFSNLQPLWALDNIKKGDKVQTILST